MGAHAAYAAALVPSMQAFVQEARAQWRSYPSAHDPRQRNPEHPGSADWHLDQWERWRLLNKSRANERENEWYDATLGNFAALVVGEEGPEPRWMLPLNATPASAIELSEFDDRLQELWWHDATKKLLDVRREHSWSSMLQLEVRTIVRDGDILVWHDDGGAVMHYETDQVGKIHRDSRGIQIRSYELNSFADSDMRVGTPEGGGGAFIDADDADFIAWRTRFGQTRGAPVLQSSLTRWARLSSLTESEIISSESSALPWTSLKQELQSPSAYGPPPTSGIDGEGESEASGDDHLDGGWVPTDAGHIMIAPRGMEAQPWIPNRPNRDIPPFVSMMLRRFVAPLCPYEVLFNDVTELSYAGIRGLGKLASKQLSRWRGSLLQNRLDRQAKDWLRQAVKDKRVTLPAGISVDDIRVEWKWDELDIRDREKDALTAEREDKLGHESMQDRLGQDWTKVQDQRHAERMRQLKKDIEYARARAELVALQQQKEPTDAE